ncbi:hypothetical protein [Streptomyces sp. NPDC059452]|uniref:hypothetical protein n=1 Tax=Streptomyces sp. NPDC059452 TaxID=3346835 RepID=UPI0036A02174
MIHALLATDDMTFHARVRARLEMTGAVTVTGWSCPDFVLPSVAAHRPDVILLDARTGRAEPLRNQLHVFRELALHQRFAVFADPGDTAIAEVARVHGATGLLAPGWSGRRLAAAVALVVDDEGLPPLGPAHDADVLYGHLHGDRLPRPARPASRPSPAHS